MVPGLKIRVFGPEFPSSSSAETPMSCGKGRKTGGNGWGASLPKLSPPIPAPIGRCGRWRGGGGCSPNRGTAPHGRIPPQNDQPKAQNFGGKSPPKVCAFGWWPFLLIGELADGWGGMAPVFQSAADPSNRRRLKIREHSRTRGELPRRLGGSNAPKDALQQSGAGSWAEREGGQ